MELRTKNLSEFIREHASRKLRLGSWGSSGILRYENIRDNPFKSVKEMEITKCGEFIVFLFDRCFYLTDGTRYECMTLERQGYNESWIEFTKKAFNKEEYYA